MVAAAQVGGVRSIGGGKVASRQCVSAEARLEDGESRVAVAAWRALGCCGGGSQ